MSHFSSNELIFNKVGDEIISAGFGINSILLNKGLPPILSFTNHYDTDHETSSSSNSSSDSESDIEESDKKKVFKTFKNLAIPLGLFLDNNDKSKNNNNKNNKYNNDEYQEHKQIPNDMYDELLKLVYYNDKEKRQTKKNTKKDKVKSRTYKKNKI
jgi:hypothetical protein